MHVWQIMKKYELEQQERNEEKGGIPSITHDFFRERSIENREC